MDEYHFAVITAAVGVFGLLWGSFLGSVADRLLSGTPLLREPRSLCETCRTTLKPRDLVPVVSWCFSRGRCRYCQTKLSIRYPIYEVSTAVAFLAAWLFNPTPSIFFILVFFWSVGFILFVSDMDTNHLSPKGLGLLALGALVYVWDRERALPCLDPQLIETSVFAGTLGLLSAGTLYGVMGPEKVGSGDVWLIGILGLWVGTGTPWAVAVGAAFTVFFELARRPWRQLTTFAEKSKPQGLGGVARPLLPLGSWLLLSAFIILCVVTKT